MARKEKWFALRVLRADVCSCKAAAHLQICDCATQHLAQLDCIYQISTN